MIQDKEVALMSAVSPKTLPPKPTRNVEQKGAKTQNIFRRIFKLIFGKKEEIKKNNKPRKYYNKNRRYNKNFKYNKYKNNNKKSFAKNSRQKNS